VSERLGTAGLVAMLVVCGAVAWWFQLRPELAVDARALDRLPYEFGEWTGEPIPLDTTVESMLRADLNLQRGYLAPGSEIIWLYVGYYGTARGGRPEHTPEVCYPSAGWRVAEARVWTDDPNTGVRANEFVVTSGDRVRLVHFWYQSSRSTGMLGTWDISVDQLASRLGNGRADGALVRLSTPIDSGDREAARDRLVGFRRLVEPEIERRWPVESPAGGASHGSLGAGS
jgi:EpsI family protein